MRKLEFPVAIRRGNVAVKIYRQLKQGRYPTFVVSYYDGSARKRVPFSDYVEARNEADDIADKLAAGDLETLRLTGTDRIVYLRAKEAADRIGVPLDLAITEYAQAFALLGGRATLLQTAQAFVRSAGADIKPRNVSEVVEDLLAAREKDGSSHRHIKDLRSRLRRFARDFSCSIGDVTAAAIHQWLLGLNLAPKSINNYRSALSNLFGFARLINAMPKYHDPIADVPEVKEPERDIKIWAIDEMKQLIDAATEEMLPYLVIAAFAGLRQSEIERLDWCHVTETHIRVPGGERRVKSKRLVEMQPNLRAWMEVLRKPTGRVVPYKNVSNEIVKLARNAGYEPRHNALRHSYASYRLAVIQNVSQVAEEMGNTPRMVRKHYAEFVTRESGEAWFNIVPATATNIISLPGA